MTPVFLSLLALTILAPRQDPVRPRVGLVLSGGGARGAAHVGVLEELEALHVPVDFVVGTSMGSIVGGLYAAGYAPERMAVILERADWSEILSDETPREDLWYRRRGDDRDFQVDLELGWEDGGLDLPSGLSSGRNVESFLDRLLLPVATVRDFDALRLPFRCVATDLGDGSEVVLEGGKLTQAIRASMSLPGVFAPVPYGDRVLVDGGVVDNVPVDVARRLGADIVIVVDISTPLADPASLRSLFGVTNQVFGILLRKNRQRSMESMTAADIAIVPDLGDITTLQFERCGEAVRIGRESAAGLRARLQPLAVDEATWARWLERQRMPEAGPPTVRRLTVGDTSLSERVIRSFSALEPGDELNARAVRKTHQQLAGLGLFEHVEMDVTPVPGSPDEVDVDLRPIEKDWGPNYLRFGLDVASDLRGGGEFTFGIQHTLRPVDALAGEWRNEAEVGTRMHLRSEFYQPLDAELRWFVAPSIEFAQDNLPVIVDQEKVAEINAQAVEIGVAVGRNLGRWGEARVGYGWQFARGTPETAVPGLLPDSIDLSAGKLFTQIAVDTLDSFRFPRRGLIGHASWELSAESLGSDETASVLEAALGAPWSLGDLTLFPRLEGGTTLEGEGRTGGRFFLGGFERLSGLTPYELSGEHYGLGVLQAYYQLSRRTSRFGLATYLGASAEAGGIWQTRDEVDTGDLRLSSSVFLGVDSFLGPAYLAYGFAEGGENAAYVFIGSSF